MGFCFSTSNMFHFISYVWCTNCPLCRKKSKANCSEGKEDHHSERAQRLTKALNKVYYDLADTENSIFLKCFFQLFLLKSLPSATTRCIVNRHKNKCYSYTSEGIIGACFGRLARHISVSLAIHFFNCVYSEMIDMENTRKISKNCATTFVSEVNFEAPVGCL